MPEKTEDSKPRGKPSAHPVKGGKASTDTAVAILLAVAAIVAALIGLRGAVLDDNGSDTWQVSIREDLARSVGVIQDADFLYGEEAPLALDVAEARIRAAQAKLQIPQAPASARPFLRGEEGSQSGLAAVIAPSAKLAHGPSAGDVIDPNALDRELKSLRDRAPALTALDPDATEASGTEDADKSVLFAIAAIPVAVAFLLGALIEGFPGWRRRLLPTGYGMVVIGSLFALVVEVAA